MCYNITPNTPSELEASDNRKQYTCCVVTLSQIATVARSGSRCIYHWLQPWKPVRETGHLLVKTQTA